jgi:tRNA threonylcarbamoyladenosine biosynthesis protein TsaB
LNQTILALDTSSDACSVALSFLGHDGCQKIDEQFERAPRIHARLLLPMINELLEKHKLSFSDLDVIAFGAGPGSFTGLRIAAGVTQGLAYAAKKPVIKISTLEALAFEKALSSQSASVVLPAIDARMNEIYWSLLQFDPTLEGEMTITTLCEEQVCQPGDMLLTLEAHQMDQLQAVGSGWLYQDKMPSPLQTIQVNDNALESVPRAGVIARLAQHKLKNNDTFDATNAIPNYLRDKVTWKKLPGRE